MTQILTAQELKEIGEKDYRYRLDDANGDVVKLLKALKRVQKVAAKTRERIASWCECDGRGCGICNSTFDIDEALLDTGWEGEDGRYR